MRRCVLGCPQGITLHKFPDDEEKRKEWLKMINMEDCPLNNLYLCTRHFARRLKGKSRLVWNAIPTRNLLGVDEDDIDCDEIDQDDEDDEIEEPKFAQLPVKKSGILILPTKGKVAESTGKRPFDPLYEPSKAVTKDQLVKHPIKFVDGRALKIPQKKTSTVVKESSKIDEKRRSTTTVSVAKKISPKVTPVNVIKHHIKIVNGKAYKIHATDAPNVSKTPKMSTFEYDAKTTTAFKNVDSPKPVPVRKSARTPKVNKKFTENFLLKNTVKVSSPTSLEHEVVDEIEGVEKHEINAITEEFFEDEAFVLEDEDTGPFSQTSRDEGVIVKFENNDVSNEFDLYGNDGQRTQLFTGINKEQPVEFGNKIRSTPRQKVGFVECFTNNNTFCLTCFYCGTEFELWDWQMLIEHLNEEHIPKRKTYPRNNAKNIFKNEPNKDTVSNNNNKQQNEETAPLTPKEEEFDDEDGDFEMAKEEDLQSILKGEASNEMQVEDSIERNSEAVENDGELYEEEEWQVDKLEEYEEVEVYEEYGSNIDDADGDVYEEEDEEQPEENELGVGEFDDEEDDVEEGDDNPDNIRKAVINFKTTDQSRVLAFLKLLRNQPMLWHPRRYGPPLYDEEMKKFLQQFDETMSPIDFRRSVENFRYQYKRFTPLTPRGRAKLQEDAFLRESIQIIKEIADKLSKPFVFPCDVCSYRFLDENRMLTHKYLKHKIGDLKYICSCGIRFEFERQKEAHENLHKLKPRFTCQLCGTHFIFNRLLRDHMNESHPETQENPLPYKCIKCDAKFPSIQKRAHHMEKHKERKYHCEICKQSYATSFRFRHHMKRHQDQRDWVCEHCGKAFVEKRSLNAHLFRLHRDGGFKCVHCRSYFANQDSLDTHNQKYHPNGTNLDRLKEMRSYFNTTYKHMKRGQPQYKRVFKCKGCTETFRSVWALVGHKRQTGHDLKVFNCPHCEAVLSNPKSLMGHMRRIHNLPIATMNDLRNELLQTVEEEQASAGEWVVPNPDLDAQAEEGDQLEEIEIFEPYEFQ